MAISERLAAMKQAQESAEQKKAEEAAQQEAAEKAAAEAGAAEREAKRGELSAERERVTAELLGAEQEAIAADSAIAEAEAFAAEQGENLAPEARAEIDAIKAEAAEAKQKFEALKTELSNIEAELEGEAVPEAEVVTETKEGLPSEIQNILEKLGAKEKKGAEFGISKDALEAAKKFPEYKNQILDNAAEKLMATLTDKLAVENTAREEAGYKKHDSVFDISRVGVVTQAVEDFEKIGPEAADKLHAFLLKEFVKEGADLNADSEQEIRDFSHKVAILEETMASALSRIGENKELPSDLEKALQDAVPVVKKYEKKAGGLMKYFNEDSLKRVSSRTGKDINIAVVKEKFGFEE